MKYKKAPTEIQASLYLYDKRHLHPRVYSKQKIQRLQARSETNIVLTVKLLSSLTLQSCTPTSACQWSTDYIEQTFPCADKAKRKPEKARSCSASALCMAHGCKLACVSWPRSDPPRQGRCTQREGFCPWAGKKTSTTGSELIYPVSHQLTSSFPIGKLRWQIKARTESHLTDRANTSV